MVLQEIAENAEEANFISAELKKALSNGIIAKFQV